MMSFILSISKRSQTCVNTNCARNAWSPEVSSNCAFKSMKSEPTEPTKRWWFASQRLNQMMSIVFALISQAERGRLATFIADEGIEDSLFRDVKPVTWCHMMSHVQHVQEVSELCFAPVTPWNHNDLMPRRFLTLSQTGSLSSSNSLAVNRSGNTTVFP